MKNLELKLPDKKTVEDILHKKGLIIAGPCSIESEEQLLSTALQLASTGKVDILRAGVWKPRTNPGGFEGLGTKSLPWLLKAKQLTGLPTAIEVASTKHVEDALSFDVDVLWIGARTSVNPFSVQNIADALKGTDIPVLIKNPVNPDLNLWIGAVERIQKAGIKTIGLIHRGFSAYGNSEYRNAPIWQIPIEMKRHFSDMPMICDPSHICGNRDGLLSIAQKSIDLDYSGFIIESHYNPEAALTDKNQQLKPCDLAILLNKLEWKQRSSLEKNYLQKLEELREQINLIDDELIQQISERMKISKEIGGLKKENKVTILQPSRYNEIIEKTIKKAQPIGLSEDFIKTYIEAVHIESIRIQNTMR